MRGSFLIDTLKVIAMALVGVVLVIVAGVGWALYNPAGAWRVVRPAVLGAGVNESWAAAQWQLKREGGLAWRFQFSAKDYQIQRATPRLDLKGDVLLSGKISFFNPTWQIHFDKVDLRSTAPGIYERPMKEWSTVQPNPQQFAEQIRETILSRGRHVTVGNLFVDVADWELFDVGVSSMHMKLTAKKPASEKSDAISSQIHLKNEDGEVSLSADYQFEAVKPGAVFLKMVAKGQGPKWGVDGHVEFALPEKQALIRGLVRSTWGAGPTALTVKSSIDANFMETRIAVGGQGDMTHLPGGINSIKNIQWSIDLPLWKGVILDHLSGQATVNGSVSLDFMGEKVRSHVEASCKCKLPEALQVDLSGKVWPAHLLAGEGEDRPITTLNFKAESLKNALVDLGLTGELRISRDKEHKFQISPTLDGDLKLPNFQALKSLLELNNIMIPSPFDVLQGGISARIKTSLWQSTRGLVIPIEVQTNLSTQVQKVNLNGKLTLYIPEGFKSMDVGVDVNVDDFIIEMPPIDPIQGFPKLASDPRLLKEPEVKDNPERFKMRVTYAVRTTKPGAVRLISKLAKPAIPLTLDLDRTAKGDILGSLKSEPFDLAYLHRTIHVDLMRIILDERDNSDFAVDGRMRMEQSQAKVYISISGSLQSPLIKLNSEPELSRSDIISVILYDRTSDQLVSADRETVGTFDAAISDRAIGLLGLWVFASTPIRSFSYNPLTKVYTATVQLVEGTTASIGTDWEQAAQLEVRKRVNRRWVLTASWAPAGEKSQTGKLVLQWEKRF